MNWIKENWRDPRIQLAFLGVLFVIMGLDVWFTGATSISEMQWWSKIAAYIFVGIFLCYGALIIYALVRWFLNLFK